MKNDYSTEFQRSTCIALKGLMCKENKSTVNYLGVYLFNTSFRYSSTRSEIYVHNALEFKCKKPQILHKLSAKCVNSEISINIQ